VLTQAPYRRDAVLVRVCDRTTVLPRTLSQTLRTCMVTEVSSEPLKHFNYGMISCVAHSYRRMWLLLQLHDTRNLIKFLCNAAGHFIFSHQAKEAILLAFRSIALHGGISAQVLMDGHVCAAT
jgi:hypothetical protein